MNIHQIVEEIQSKAKELGVDGFDVSVNPLDGKPYVSATVSHEAAGFYEVRRVYPRNVEVVDDGSVKEWATEMQAKKQELIAAQEITA